jgi:hypothetical protein
MIKDCLAFLLVASPGLFAEAATRTKGSARFGFASKSASNDASEGFNQTITEDSTNNAYYGSMFIGYPLQGAETNKIAYDTAAFASLAPSNVCTGCQDKWYDQDASSTFSDADT